MMIVLHSDIKKFSNWEYLANLKLSQNCGINEGKCQEYMALNNLSMLIR